MLNMLRADFYRLFRSKGFYINQIILISLVFLSVAYAVLGTIGVQTDELHQLQSNAADSVWTGASALANMSAMASVLLYFCLPLLTMTIGYDLTRSTYKNLLTSDVSRLDFFISKHLVFIAVSTCQLIFYYMISFLTAAIKNGIGDFGSGFAGNFLRTFSIQWLCLQAVFALAILVLYLLFSNVGAVITVIVFPLAVSIVHMLVPKMHFLQYVSFQMNIDAAWIITVGGEHYWLKVILSSVLFILGALTLGYQTFRRKNL